jgi:hypothetical protein
MFSQATVEQIGFYVYFLKDPRNNEVFYVGKGQGNRVFEHLACALETEAASAKLDTIRMIESSGCKVRHYILRHGLSEQAAFEVEAALIDFISRDKLANKQGGHHSSDFGLCSAEEISARYEAADFSPRHPVMLININKMFHRDMTPEALYEATRKSWVVADKKDRAVYAIATYRGLTREVYRILRWERLPEEGENRWGFVGEPAEQEVREEYRYKSILNYFKRGAANPIRYINCDSQAISPGLPSAAPRF